MSETGIEAAGAGWRMPGKLKSKNFRDSTAPLLNSIGDSVERANKMDFGREGIHTQHGFFQTNPDAAQSSAMIIVLLRDALFPGTYDLPGVASGTLMEQSGSGNTLQDTGEDVEVVNYSTSIYGPIGGLVLCNTFNGLNVAVGSSG